ncbi:hypothetical protein CC2G_001916 [Coprinopsis cinerea AmutBmut pab1-1]|nr:hypothetical protein CC2G_001916 [Coprinopsis cinerea AmutBmut pab1-1]
MSPCRKVTAAPIDSVPYEVLGRSFLYYVYHLDEPANETASHPIAAADKFNQNSPLLLSSVYSRWRTVANGTPALWANIAVDNPSENTVFIFQLWLERSQGLPLDLTIIQNFCNRSRHLYGPNSPLGQIVTAALTQSFRWRNIKILAPERELNIPKWMSMPNLKSLDVAIFIERNFKLRLHRELYSRICSAPTLQTVKFSGQCFRPSWIPGIHWSSITTVNIDESISSNKLLKMFKLASSIRKCSIKRLFLTSAARKQNFGVIVAPSLQELELRFTEGCPYFLDHLSLPALVKLTLEVPSPFYEYYGVQVPPRAGLWQRIAQLGERSEWKLTVLDFHCITRRNESSSHNIGTWAASPAFAHLTTFRHHGEGASRTPVESLSALTFRDTFKPMPQLETLDLELGFPYPMEDTDEAICELLLSRTKGINDATLRYANFKMKLDSDILDKCFPLFTDLEIPGVVIECTCLYPS